MASTQQSTNTYSIARALFEEAKKEELHFRNMLPTSGFIGAYMRYTDRQESPGSYHFWVGATMLSSVLQRKAWVSKGIYNVYPTVFTILVGPSGRCRKSRAMRLGLELIEDFDFMNIIADKTSPEAFLQALMEGTNTMTGAKKSSTGSANINIATPDASGLVRTTELGVFLNKQTYTSGMVGILTDLFDCPDDFRYITRNSKPIVLHNVAVTFLGATTPKWLATNMPEGAFEGGFVSRFIMIVKNARDRHISFPEEPPPSEKQELKRMLAEMHAKFHGSIPLENVGRNWYDKWYQTGTADIVENEEMSGFAERKPDYVLKLAMILCASDMRKTITEEDLIRAKNILDWTQAKMFDAFAHIDLSHIGNLMQKVKEELRLRGGRMSRRDIMRKFGGRIHGLKDMEEIEAIMRESEDIKVMWKIDPHISGKAPKMYVLVGEEKKFTDMSDNDPTASDNGSKRTKK